VVIDDGAVHAIRNKGASLLPGGIVAVTGVFAKDQTIDIRDAKGDKVARGIALYDSQEIGLIKGHKAQMIEKLLGYCYRQEVVHRDDMVVLDVKQRSATNRMNEEQA
jgi:glutamate 5-kinase